MTMKGKCERHAVVRDGVIQQKLWNLYLKELGPSINEETAFPQQCFSSFDIFAKALTDPDFVKFVLFSEEGDIVGLTISSNNLQKIKDIAGVKFNLEKYQKDFPDDYSQGKIHYFPVMCLHKNYQDEGYMDSLGNAMITMVNENWGKAAFDFAEEKNKGLDEMIVYLAKKLNLRPNAKTTLVGKQTFVIVG